MFSPPHRHRAPSKPLEAIMTDIDDEVRAAAGALLQVHGSHAKDKTNDAIDRLSASAVPQAMAFWRLIHREFEAIESRRACHCDH